MVGNIWIILEIVGTVIQIINNELPCIIFAIEIAIKVKSVNWENEHAEGNK